MNPQEYTDKLIAYTEQVSNRRHEEELEVQREISASLKKLVQIFGKEKATTWANVAKTMWKDLNEKEKEKIDDEVSSDFEPSPKLKPKRKKTGKH